ncbi:MAG: F0F1 ATP synthase subunit B [Veillonella sp.]|nr:F0F1 ATP synthase subunit B [Veillonella sp.]
MVDLSLGTILAQMLNFFILVWLLARFAYKPLLAMMTERKERIAKDLEAAEKARVEAEGFKADYAAQIAKARQEAQQIVEKAVQEAENTTREQLATAREQIEQEKNRARQDIAIERDRAMNSLRNEVVSLSVAMAGKVVAKDMNSETNTKLIEDAIRQLDSKTELMEEQLGYVASVMVDQPELRSFLENPIVTEDAKIKLIGKIFDSSIDKVALHFIYVMIKRGRYRYIASTIEAFIKKSRAARGILEATVTVAKPITADVEASVQAKLREVTGKDVILSVRQDPSIMGGIVIQVGDKRIDGSVARRLEELEKSLLRTNSIR